MTCWPARATDIELRQGCCCVSPNLSPDRKNGQIGEPLIENAPKSLLKLQSLAGGHEWECSGVIVHQDPEELMVLLSKQEQEEDRWMEMQYFGI